jgi:predicted membrane protein
VIDTEVVFGGSEQVYLDPVFRGGQISTVFGGVKLDLRRTELPEGETWLTVESVFGGVEIDAPAEWNIEIRGESVFGGFTDRRPSAVGDGYGDGRKLIIKASCVFGGGEIK